MMPTEPRSCSRCGLSLVDPNTGARRVHDEDACAAERGRVEAQFDAADQAELDEIWPDMLRARF